MNQEIETKPLRKKIWNFLLHQVKNEFVKTEIKKLFNTEINKTNRSGIWLLSNSYLVFSLCCDSLLNFLPILFAKYVWHFFRKDQSRLPMNRRCCFELLIVLVPFPWVVLSMKGKSWLFYSLNQDQNLISSSGNIHIASLFFSFFFLHKKWNRHSQWCDLLRINETREMNKFFKIRK